MDIAIVLNNRKELRQELLDIIDSTMTIKHNLNLNPWRID